MLFEGIKMRTTLRWLLKGVSQALLPGSWMQLRQIQELCTTVSLFEFSQILCCELIWILINLRNFAKLCTEFPTIFSITSCLGDYLRNLQSATATLLHRYTRSRKFRNFLNKFVSFFSYSEYRISNMVGKKGSERREATNQLAQSDMRRFEALI